MLVAAESASRVAGPAPAVKDGAGSLDRAEGLDAGADGSGQRVGDEVARADQQRAILLRVVHALIRVAATAQGQGTRLRIESEAVSARRLVAAGVNAWTLRRVRAALARAT